MWEWIDDRWHLDGKPVHAGDSVEMRWPDGTWEAVRIESSQHGLHLWAHFRHHGEKMSIQVNNGEGTDRKFRWLKR